MEVLGRRQISAVLIAFNEEQRIADCLSSLHWVDEIVVVDSGSSDATKEIARRFTDKVFDMPWRGFGPQKQAAVELASHDIIFSIDADERVTPELIEEITNILTKSDMASCYSVPRRTFLGENEIRHCGWYPDRTVRLFDRTQAGFSDDPVHERVITCGVVQKCHNHLLHFSFSGIKDMLVKMNLYTDIASRRMYERGRRFNLSYITLRPIFTFFKTFVLQAGFLDGVPGLTVALSNSFSVFVKYVKLREIEIIEEKVSPHL